MPKQVRSLSIYRATIERLQQFRLNRPGFRRHLAAINYGLGGGGYEHEAVHR